MFIPNRNVRSNRNYPKWMTDNLKHLIGMKKRDIQKKKKKNRETNLKERYTAVRKDNKSEKKI